MGDMMAPQNVSYHCALTLRRRMLKLGDLKVNINININNINIIVIIIINYIILLI